MRILSLLISLAGGAMASSFAIQTVQSPSDPTFTELLGINNTGTIAGFFGAVTAKGFTLTPPNSFANENFPGSAQTMVTGINQNGDTVGIYVDTGGTTHGFTDIGGTFRTVDQPGTVFNQGLGINSSDTTVGYSSASDPMGVVGETAYSQFGGVFTNINALLPANDDSQAAGINNAGSIVGFYMEGTDSIGFLDVGGTISTIDPFGSVFTQPLGINDSGEIVGFYLDAGGFQHGFIDNGGVFTTFDPAGSMGTTINGVNDLGQIVGFYTDANDDVIGFVGTPTPEPATLTLVGAGLVAGLGILRRKKGSLRIG